MMLVFELRVQAATRQDLEASIAEALQGVKETDIEMLIDFDGKADGNQAHPGCSFVWSVKREDRIDYSSLVPYEDLEDWYVEQEWG